MDNGKINTPEPIVKAVGVCLLGIVIPNISGLINNAAYPWRDLLFSYGYFILIAAIIWQGNTWIMIYLRSLGYRSSSLKLNSNWLFDY